MDAEANLKVQMTRLTQPLGLLLIVNNSKEVSIIHHTHNFGGTLLCPTHKVGCLVGMGPNATLVVLDHRSALSPVIAFVPPIGDIKACLMAEALAALPIPCPRGVVNLEGINCFIPAPFLHNVILLADSFAPLTLVLAGPAAQDNHARNHNEDEGFSEANIDAHMDHFYLWCLGVHQGQVPRLILPSPRTMTNFRDGAHVSTTSTFSRAFLPQLESLPPWKTPPTSFV